MIQAHQNIYIVMISFIAAIAGLLFGFDTGIISGALQFIAQTFAIPNHHNLIKEIIVSAVPFGALIGAICSKVSAVRLGRRNSIITTGILFIIGILCAAGAPDVMFLVLGRLLMGFAVGLSAMIVPMYLSEVAPYRIRGAMVFCFQLAINLGLWAAFLVNYIFADSANWRSMFAIGLIPAVLLTFGMLLLPYSPRWLILKRADEKARCVLNKLRQPQEVERELYEIKASVRHQQGNLITLLTKPTRGVAWVCFLLFGFQQLSGINTIMYYAPTIYKNAGFESATDQIMASLLHGLVFVLATLWGLWVVDKLGRRKLFFIGFVGMTACLALIGANYQGLLHTTIGHWIALASVMGYILFFGISLGPLCYLIMSELFPLNVRSIGMAMASCGNWGFNVLVSSTFLTLVDTFGIGHTFYFYTGCTIVGLIFCYCFIPETKNISLEHIESNLYAGCRLRDLGKSLKGQS